VNMKLNSQLDLRAIRTSPPARVALALLAGLAGVLLLLLSLLAGFGLLYVLRGLRWFAVGPRIADSLPLLRLAGFDGQPLVRVAAAWLPAGMIFGLALIHVKSLRLVIITSVFAALLLLLFASDVVLALAENLRLSHVLWTSAPGVGPWVEVLLFIVGSVVPVSIARRQRSGLDAVLDREQSRCIADPA
jgi:hypothetical protein